MSLNMIDLTKLHDQPIEIREAVAFYTSFGATMTHYPKEERERHYNVLERAGYIEKVGGNDVSQA